MIRMWIFSWDQNGIRITYWDQNGIVMCSNRTTYIYIHIHMYVSNAIYLGIWMDNKNDVGVVDDDGHYYSSYSVSVIVILLLLLLFFVLLMIETNRHRRYV